MKTKRAAATLAVSLVIALIVAACASMSGGGRDLVARGVQAQGGADALASVKTVSQKATVRYWEPEQSAVAGGEIRFANESTLDMVTDVAGGASWLDWVRKFEYPAPGTFTFSEIVTAEAGYVAGIDSSGRTKQSMESNPPAHTMSGLRLAAAQRELLRTSPLLLLEMWKNPERVTGAGRVTVGGATYPAVSYQAGTQTFQVYAIEPNPHAQGLLIGYVPDAKLAFATGIWSRGARCRTSSTRPSPRWSRA
jgi:predicted small secreted protein